MLSITLTGKREQLQLILFPSAMWEVEAVISGLFMVEDSITSVILCYPACWWWRCSWQPVTDYIDTKFEEYLNAESKVNRKSMPDNRVQCCLYFIAPTGHRYDNSDSSTFGYGTGSTPPNLLGFLSAYLVLSPTLSCTVCSVDWYTDWPILILDEITQLEPSLKPFL